MRRWVWVVSGVLLLLLAVSFLAAVLLAEGAIHPARTRRQNDSSALALRLAQASSARAQKVNIVAKDGVSLNAWWISPNQGDHRAVLVSHGVGDSSYGALGFAPFHTARASPLRQSLIKIPEQIVHIFQADGKPH